MTSINLNALINLLGFALGVALYGLLLAMVLRYPVSTLDQLSEERTIKKTRIDGLLLTTALWGIVWNAGAFIVNGAREWGISQVPLWLVATSFTAFGFLPAVVVHTALQPNKNDSRNLTAKVITGVAYGISAIAGAMHFIAIKQTGFTPSVIALRGSMFGSLALILALFWATRHKELSKQIVWASALSLFTVAVLHLSNHHAGETDISVIELIGHHASLPLALAVLYQDYRFAFADLFLKRALSLLLLAGVTLSLYVFVATRFLAMRDANGDLSANAVGGLLALWMVTALLYPVLNRGVNWFVDTVVLRRTDYNTLRNEIAQTLAKHESVNEALNAVAQKLAPALTAKDVRWSIVKSPSQKVGNEEEKYEQLEQAFLPDKLEIHKAQDLVIELDQRSTEDTASVFIPTAEPVFYEFIIGSLSGGRRLLSDDIVMLETIAVMAARRIDALRVTHERCEQIQREQEIGKLATEAQLKALRAQINPHFLFNALTTIGYLIKASPDRALDTLMRLTELLRGALRSSSEFVTLGEELKLIASYLEIEQARFEERLRVKIDVPNELRSLKIPSLLIQPLVENAIKHGIAPLRSGGDVMILARCEKDGTGLPGPEKDTLVIIVQDTGAGVSEIELARNRSHGVGLNNVEQRLRSYFGSAACLTIESAPNKGAIVCVRFPAAKTNKLKAENNFTELRRPA